MVWHPKGMTSLWSFHLVVVYRVLFFIFIIRKYFFKYTYSLAHYKMAIIIKYVTTQGTTTPPLLAVFLRCCWRIMVICREEDTLSRPRRCKSTRRRDQQQPCRVMWQAWHYSFSLTGHKALFAHFPPSSKWLKMYSYHNNFHLNYDRIFLNFFLVWVLSFCELKCSEKKFFSIKFAPSLFLSISKK